MAKKRSRKSQTSKGIQGSSTKARTSTGMKRLLNQLEAHKAGKRTKIVVPVLDPFVPNPATASSKRFIENPKCVKHSFETLLGADYFPKVRA